VKASKAPISLEEAPPTAARKPTLLFHPLKDASVNIYHEQGHVVTTQ